VHKALKARKVHKETLVLKGSKEIKVLQEIKDHKVRKEMLVLQDFKDQLVLLEIKVAQVQLVEMDSKEDLDFKEFQDSKAIKVV
jgi:hypothetical protein